MTKYLVFGWSELNGGPADEFLGTTSEIDTDIEHDYEVGEEDGKKFTTFGYRFVEKVVELDKKLLQGKPRVMNVLMTWGHEGFENARPMLAYMDVGRRPVGEEND